MKKIRIGALVLAGTMLVSSCTSSYQASGGVTGAMIGSHIGEAIGFLSGHGHFRGHNAALGSLIGAGIGAALGVGVASAIEENEQKKYEDYERSRKSSQQNGGYESNVGQSSGDYQTGGGAYADANSSASNDSYNFGSESKSLNVSLSELSYMDADGDGFFSKGETCEIEGYITNTSGESLRDIVIYLSIDDNKDFNISPSLTTTLAPGQKIRYTGRVYCKKARNGQTAVINLNATCNNKNCTSNSLCIGMK